MPKITTFVDLEDLKKKKNLKRYAHIKDRILVIILASEGLTSEAIADKLDKSRAFVTKWVTRFNKGGFSSLEDLPRSGQPRKITPLAENTILEMVAAGPSLDSILSRFRIEDFQKAIRNKHNIHVSAGTVGRFLKKTKLYNASC